MTFMVVFSTRYPRHAHPSSLAVVRIPKLPAGFDLNVYNERQIARRRGETIAALRSSLGESRAQLLAFLDGLNADQLERRGWHASGREVTVAEMFEILAWHEETHAKDMLSARGG